MKTLGTSLLLMPLALALAATTAQAGPRDGAVTVQSEYGNGTVTGPVRAAQFGHQVRLPGGTWIYCEITCADTLRRESIDFWETRSEESGGDHK